MRVYVPMTSTLLSRLWNDKGLMALPTTAFAVTPGLREWYSEENDDEELEYAASTEAARASLRLMAADSSAIRRRMVLAADVDDDAVDVRDDLDLGVVRVTAPVPLASCASVHVDDGDAVEVVARAVELVDEADLGVPEAEAAVDDTEGHELCWYAIQEIPRLLVDIGGSDPAPSTV